MLNRNRVRSEKNKYVVILISALFVLPWLAVIAIILGELHQIRTSPAIAKGLASMNRYSCIRGEDKTPPYSHRVGELASITYYSMGGKNWIQAMWLIPITELGIRTLYSKNEISRLYASRAFVYGTLTNERIVGFDALSRRLYGKDYCTLSSVNKSAIEFLFYPLDNYLPGNISARIEIDRARKVLGASEGTATR